MATAQATRTTKAVSRTVTQGRKPNDSWVLVLIVVPFSLGMACAKERPKLCYKYKSEGLELIHVKAIDWGWQVWASGEFARAEFVPKIKHSGEMAVFN